MEMLQGDLLELYEERLEQHSQRWAKIRYVLDALDLSWRSVAFEKHSQKTIYYGMLKNYFKISYRNFLNQKVYSFIFKIFLGHVPGDQNRIGEIQCCGFITRK